MLPLDQKRAMRFVGRANNQLLAFAIPHSCTYSLIIVKDRLTVSQRDIDKIQRQSHAQANTGKKYIDIF